MQEPGKRRYDHDGYLEVRHAHGFYVHKTGFMIRVKVKAGLMCFKYIKGVVSGRETRESEKTIQW